MIDTLARRPEIFTNLAQVDNQWVELAGNVRHDLFNVLAKSGKLDCRQANLREGEYVDLWGNAILVSFKKEPLHVIKWRFLSSGPDGSFRTDDDISIGSP